jgi:hypothetical protein
MTTAKKPSPRKPAGKNPSLRKAVATYAKKKAVQAGSAVKKAVKRKAAAVVCANKNPVQKKLQSRPKPAGRLNKRVFTVEMKDANGVWIVEGFFPTEKSAREYAYALDAKYDNSKYIRVTV